ADIEGIQVPGMATMTKLMAYADDFAVYLKNIQEWLYLQETFAHFGAISNAKLNVDKMVAFPMGQSSPEMENYFKSINIEWHDATAPLPQRYLGYPVISAKHQLAAYYKRLARTIKAALKSTLRGNSQ
ncbi:hypothetical protein BGX27_002599, partial [Mortierella sp. AM989]